MNLFNLRQTGSALQAAFNTLASIAASKGHGIKSLTISVENTDLTAGKVEGLITVRNRSRRPFKLEVQPTGTVAVTCLGVTKNVNA